MTPGDLLAAETRAWLGKAREDLQSARSLLQSDLVAPALFHCQQAVEKSFKAFLTSRGIVFRKTHDLEEVGSACVALEPTLAALVRAAEPLTAYAWKFRYPGDPNVPDVAEAAQALSTAETVYQEIVSRLPEAASPPS
jgi:HEPN domain-containing protein